MCRRVHALHLWLNDDSSSPVQRSTQSVLSCTVLYCPIPYYFAPHCTALLLCSALFCSALHCTALHYCSALPRRYSLLCLLPLLLSLPNSRFRSSRDAKCHAHPLPYPRYDMPSSSVSSFVPFCITVAPSFYCAGSLSLLCSHIPSPVFPPASPNPLALPKNSHVTHHFALLLMSS